MKSSEYETEMLRLLNAVENEVNLFFFKVAQPPLQEVPFPQEIDKIAEMEWLSSIGGFFLSIDDLWDKVITHINYGTTHKLSLTKETAVLTQTLSGRIRRLKDAVRIAIEGSSQTNS